MLQIKVFGTTPPCANCLRAEKQARAAAAAFGDQVEVVVHTGPGDPEWEQYAINNAPALVVGDLVKFVGLAPSKASLIGALREAGME